MFLQLINVAGAGMVLGAYVGYQRGLLAREQRIYNALNLLGALLLAWVAIVDLRWGFILLETVWAAVSIPPLLRPPSGSRARGPSDR